MTKKNTKNRLTCKRFALSSSFIHVRLNQSIQGNKYKRRYSILKWAHFKLSYLASILQFVFQTVFFATYILMKNQRTMQQMKSGRDQIAHHYCFEFRLLCVGFSRVHEQTEWCMNRLGTKHITFVLYGSILCAFNLCTHKCYEQ